MFILVEYKFLLNLIYFTRVNYIWNHNIEDQPINVFFSRLNLKLKKELTNLTYLNAW